MRLVFRLNLGAGVPALSTDEQFYHVRQNAEQTAFELARRFNCTVDAFEDNKWLFSMSVMKKPHIQRSA